MCKFYQWIGAIFTAMVTGIAVGWVSYLWPIGKLAMSLWSVRVGIVAIVIFALSSLYVILHKKKISDLKVSLIALLFGFIVIPLLSGIYLSITDYKNYIYDVSHDSALPGKIDELVNIIILHGGILFFSFSILNSAVVIQEVYFMKNRDVLIKIMINHHINKKQAAHLISMYASAPSHCSVETIESWLMPPTKQNSKNCPSWAIKSLRMALNNHAKQS